MVRGRGCKVVGCCGGIRADALVSHEHPPERAESEQLDDDHPGQVADKAVFIAGHALSFQEPCQQTHAVRSRAKSLSQLTNLADSVALPRTGEVAVGTATREMAARGGRWQAAP